MKFLKELGFLQLANIELFNDNQGAGNPVFHSRSKYFDIRRHIIRDVLATQTLKLSYLPSEKIIIDILTKSLVASKHIFYSEEFGLVPVQGPPRSKLRKGVGTVVQLKPYVPTGRYLSSPAKCNVRYFSPKCHDAKYRFELIYLCNKIRTIFTIIPTVFHLSFTRKPPSSNITAL